MNLAFIFYDKNIGFLIINTQCAHFHFFVVTYKMTNILRGKYIFNKREYYIDKPGGIQWNDGVYITSVFMK